MWQLMKPSWCPKLNAGVIWDFTADIELEQDDDNSLRDRFVIYRLLALKLTKENKKPPTEPSEGNFSIDRMTKSTCLTPFVDWKGIYVGQSTV